MEEPDYTRGETTVERYQGKENWNYSALGPVGAIAEVWGNTGTEKTRMLRIMRVIKGTPADGVLRENDVVLGVVSPVGTKTGRFEMDARKAMAAAIAGAERKVNDGRLVLTIYRPEGDPKDGKGKTMPVTLTLPVLPDYSKTSPWACDKTEAIIDAACKSVLARGLYDEKKDETRVIKGGIPTRLEVLGLLATGEDQYAPIIKAYVRELADSKKTDSGSFSSWSISYEMLLLTEYYLATQDEYVLPAIRHTARRIAQGASDVGTFSHGSAYSFTAHGRNWKYPSAYGAMNQCSITCAMALVLARKCGVEDPEVDEVIQKAAYFYRWYVDKGAIPYGDHEPYMAHDNNGVNSQVAVLFDLLGDKEATRSFLPA